MTYDEIITGIKNDDERVIKFIYTDCRSIAMSAIKNDWGIEKQTIFDIYADALITFIGKVKYEKGFALVNTKLSTYLYEICRRQGLDALKVKKVKSRIENNIVQFDYWENSYMDEILPNWLDLQEIDQNQKKLLQLLREELDKLKKAGSQCYKLIKLIFFDKIKTLKEISILMGHATTDTTKTQSYKCKRELKNQINKRIKGQ